MKRPRCTICGFDPISRLSKLEMPVDKVNWHDFMTTHFSLVHHIKSKFDDLISSSEEH